MSRDLDYTLIKADKSIGDFVEGFWMLTNHSDANKDIVVLPDGRIDLIFSRSPAEPFRIALLGLAMVPDLAQLTARRQMVAVSFKPLATEYVFNHPVADLFNRGRVLPTDFWGCSARDLDNFDHFREKLSSKIQSMIPATIDTRKQQLFDYIFSLNGGTTVSRLSESVFWSSRQINRYFNQQYGLSLKAYCNILRFRASFQHIKDGKLFPKESFADQSHFIREVKKLSGVSPKELNKNPNDRFIQFSTLSSK